LLVSTRQPTETSKGNINGTEITSGYLGYLLIFRSDRILS